ncbi:hypothetical protein GDO78_021197 [Eleutherodactylus coqui]|uniref:Uncharacterized protein n=1 Tax=Eleutherodactylus coqui TaxID=57060 RepID=A0A8J6JT08_ELECQ|nr:hypothetical protein GDO78_021197 [Eleutherodactylus coqui]
MLNGGLGIPEQAIPQMVMSLRNFTISSLNYISYPSDIIMVVETIKILSTMAVVNNIPLNAAAMSNLVTVFSRLLTFDLNTFWIPALATESSIGSTLLQSVEMISRLFEPGSNNFIRLNVQMSTVVLTSLTWTDYYTFFNTTPNISVSIKNIAMSDSSNITVINMVLRNLGKILPLNFGESVKGYDHSVESHVVVNTIKTGNQTVTQADLHVVFFRRMEPNSTDVGTAQCVFWDNSLFEGAGGWSTEGCQTILVNDSVECQYRQVAAYSVLMSLGVFEEDVLETVSQVGAGLSILSLLACLIIYIIEWKFVVKDDISLYRQVVLINIAVSMCMADVWFLTSTLITESHTNKLCIAAAFLQHVFYLASLFWMLLQSFILLYELVFTFQLIKVAVLLVMAWIGYICPLIIASVMIGIEYPKGGYITEGTCFLNEEDGAIFAFSGPVLLIVVLNKFTIVAMVWKLLRPPADEEPEEDGKALVSKALAILTSVFGIIWILKTMTELDEVHEAFDYILTILETYQGVIILIFGCLLDKRVSG